MSLVELPNGKVVDVDDNASPEVIRQLMALNPATPQSTAPKPYSEDPVRNEAHARLAQVQAMGQKYNTEHPILAALSKLKMLAPGYSPDPIDAISSADDNGYLNSFGGGGAKGVTANFLDELAGLVGGATHPTDFARNYHIGKDMSQERSQQLQDAHPLTNMAGELAGALMVPIGDGAASLTGVSKLAGEGSTIGRAAGNVASRIEAAPTLVRAAMAGAGQGAVNAAGAADNDVMGSIDNGALAGAVGGGLLGGAVKAGSKVYHILKDVAPGNASQVAYMRLADLLDKGSITPERAALELNRSERAGNSSAVMDLTPGLRSQAGIISRHPDVPLSNDIIHATQQRIEDRPDLFNDAVNRIANPPLGSDATALNKSLDASRLAKGQADYSAAGAHPLAWSDKLDELFNGKTVTVPGMEGAQKAQAEQALVAIRQEISKARASGSDDVVQALQGQEQSIVANMADKQVLQKNPYIQEALAQAKKLAQGEGADPLKHTWVYDGGESLSSMRTPTLQTWDYLKRGIDSRIKQAIDSGDRNGARVLSGISKDVREELGNLNPPYKQALANQADMFQRQEALKTGQDAIRRMRLPNNEARNVLSELQALPADKQAEARTGIIDAITGLRNNKQNPVAFVKQALNNPDQRGVLEFAFGSPQKLSQFERWISTETEANRADILSAPGRTSETARFMFGDNEAKAGITQLLLDGARGYAFGGPMGGIGNSIRRLATLSSGIGTHAENELARVLMSNGKDLPKQIAGVRDFAQKRKLGDLARILAGAKAGQQIPSDIVSD